MVALNSFRRSRLRPCVPDTAATPVVLLLPPMTRWYRFAGLIARWLVLALVVMTSFWLGIEFSSQYGEAALLRQHMTVLEGQSAAKRNAPLPAEADAASPHQNTRPVGAKDGVRIDVFEFRRIDPGTWRYYFDALGDGNRFKGALRFRVLGQSADGGPVDLLVPGSRAEEDLVFRHRLRSRGTLTLPAEITLTQVEIQLVEGGAIRARRSSALGPPDETAKQRSERTS